jgi:hypothetical protein
MGKQSEEKIGRSKRQISSNGIRFPQPAKILLMMDFEAHREKFDLFESFTYTSSRFGGWERFDTRNKKSILPQTGILHFAI